MAATRKSKEKEAKPKAEVRQAAEVVVPASETATVVVDAVAQADAEQAVVVHSFDGYIGAIGRRKTSYASARISNGKGAITVNGKPYAEYFPTEEMRHQVEAPLKKLGIRDKFSISVVVHGGGIHSQAGAVRHAIARALVAYDGEFRKRVKRHGYLTRDPRVKERRKFGLKKARKAPQWAKR